MPPYKSGTDKVFAFYADNGARVPGWPVTTAGPTFGSPVIGTLGAVSTPVVVATSGRLFDYRCRPARRPHRRG